MKKLSLVLFVTWSIMLVTILTFGTSVASKITSYVSDKIYSSKNKLMDVSLDDQTFIIEKEYTLNPIIYPSTCSNPDLVFESLDPSIFTVEDNVVIGKRMKDSYSLGTLLVTSKTYPEFRKEITIAFVKSYATSYETTLLNEYGILKKDTNVYIHTPFTITTELSNENGYVSEKLVTYKFDKTLFDIEALNNTDMTLVPRYNLYKIGDEFNPFSTGIEIYVNGQLKEIRNITINNLLYEEQFTECMFASSDEQYINMNKDVYVNDLLFVELFNNGKKLITPFTITSSDEEVIKIYDSTQLKFLKPGKANITISLKNGQSKTYLITVKNKLSLPILENPKLENNTIHLYEEHNSTIKVSFKGDGSYEKWTYQVEGDCINVTLDEEKNLSFEAKKIGTSSIIITVDDGIERPVSTTIKVIVEQNPNSKSSVTKSFGKFLAKFAGHICFFILEAFLAYFMMMYYKTGKRWINILVFFGIGLFLASLTEVIQIFMPGRYPRVQDVLIDMLGYIIGLLISILFFYIIKKFKEKKETKNEES